MRRFAALIVLFASLALLPAAHAQAPNIITTVAGGGPNNVPGPTANFAFLYHSAPDANGNLFFPDTGRCGAFKMNSSGLVTLIAGQLDNCGFGGDAGPALSAQLNHPGAVGVDALGNVFISDTNNQRIRRVDAVTQVITTVAGNGVSGFGGDGGPATSANLSLNPFAPAGFFDDGVVVDASGNLFIADSFNNRVRLVVAATGNISTVAGTGVNGFGGDGGPGTAALLSSPRGLVLAASGVLLIDDFGNNRIRKLDPATGTITTIAGGGAGCPGQTDPVGDGCLATLAPLNKNEGVGVDGAGNVFIADRFNNRVRRVDAVSGIITTVAGTGTAGFLGDGGAALSAEINSPVGVSANAAGDIFIADTNNVRIRRVDHVTGIITTVAGNGSQTYSGNGVPAVDASLNAPTGSTTDAAGNLFFADARNFVVRRIDHATGIITTIAGTPGVNTFGGDGGPATSAGIAFPDDVGVDGAGNVFIADRNANRIRRVDAATGVITTAAGNGVAGFFGDGGLATAAQLNGPIGVSANAVGDLFIADSGNNRIRRVDHTSQIITTIAGTGAAGYTGDNGPAVSATLNFPEEANLDITGNILIADRGNSVIRRVNTATGIITTVAGNGTVGSSGDGGLATAAQLSTPETLAVDLLGDFFIADFATQRVRSVDGTTGNIFTVAGNGTSGFSGDGGPGPSAMLNTPEGTAVDGFGNLFISDTVNNRIRQVTLGAPGGPVVSVPSNFGFGGVTIPTTSSPQNLGLQNFGTAALNFTVAPSISGPNAADFTITANTCLPSTPVAANGGFCNVTMTFKPTLTTVETATLTFTDNAVPSPQIVALSGQGFLPLLSVNPPAGLNFGNQTQGLPSAAMMQGVDVSPNGGDLLIASLKITGPNAADFSITANNCGAKVFADSSCTVTVIFTPSNGGNTVENANISLAGNQAGSPLLIPLTGTGQTGTTSFNFTPAPGTGTQVTITGGSTAQFTIMLNPSASSVGPVMFTCSGNPPTTICAITPSSGTLNGSTPITLLVTLRTNCITSLPPLSPMNLPPVLPPSAVGGWLLSLLALAAVRKFAPQTRLARVAPAVAMLLLTMTWMSCGGSSVIAVPGQPTTAPGLYTITITATSPGGISQNIQLVVRVV